MAVWQGKELAANKERVKKIILWFKAIFLRKESFKDVTESKVEVMVCYLPAFWVVVDTDREGASGQLPHVCSSPAPVLKRGRLDSPWEAQWSAASELLTLLSRTASVQAAMVFVWVGLKPINAIVFLLDLWFCGVLRSHFHPFLFTPKQLPWTDHTECLWCPCESREFIRDFGCSVWASCSALLALVFPVV